MNFPHYVHPTVELLTVSELATKLKVSTHTVYYWINRYSDFPSHLIGKHRRFKLEEVLVFWDRRAQELAACRNPQHSLKRAGQSCSLKIRNANCVGPKTKGIGHGDC